MPTFTEHAEGMPCWIDASVATKELREALINFYSSVFGWSFDVGAPETGFYSIARHNGKAVLGIGEQSDGQGNWITYFSTSDIQAACEVAKAEGGQVFFLPMQVMDVGWMALVMDPTGVVHGFWQPITFPGFEVQYEPNAPGWFDHFSHDPARAAAYYDKVLGREIAPNSFDGMTILQRGDQWFASLSPVASSEKEPQWTPIFVVDSLDVTTEKVRALGGTVIAEHLPVPGSALSVYLDPVVGSYLTVMKSGEASNSGD